MFKAPQEADTTNRIKIGSGKKLRVISIYTSQHTSNASLRKSARKRQICSFRISLPFIGISRHKSARVLSARQVLRKTLSNKTSYKAANYRTVCSSKGLNQSLDASGVRLFVTLAKQSKARIKTIIAE